MELNNSEMKWYAIAALIGFIVVLFLLFSGHAFGTAVEKITWCHVEPNGNSETLELPLAALVQAGHVNAQGNPLHAGDHVGACEQPTPTPKCTPTPSPTGEEEEVTPTEEVATPSDTPTPTEEQKPSQDNPGGPGDGRSDGLSSCPECTKAHNEDKVINQSGQPLMPPSNSPK